MLYSGSRRLKIILYLQNNLIVKCVIIPGRISADMLAQSHVIVSFFNFVLFLNVDTYETCKYSAIHV